MCLNEYLLTIRSVYGAICLVLDQFNIFLLLRLITKFTSMAIHVE